MYDGVAWRALAATVVVGLVVGVVTFAVGFGTFVILDDTIDTEATAPLSTTEATFEDVDVPDWTVAGWNFYAAHFLQLEYAFGPDVDVGQPSWSQPYGGIPGNESGSYVTLTPLLPLYLVPPLCLIAGGAIVSRLVPTQRNPAFNLAVGAAVVAGYFPAATVGMNASTVSTSVLGVRMAYGPGGVTPLATTVYPFLFGLVGSIVDWLYRASNYER